MRPPVDRGVIIPAPGRQIPIWVGGFSRRAFERGVTLGDGFIFAGDETRVHDALAALRDLAGQRNRKLDDFGLDYVATTLTSPAPAADAARRWRDAGGTHFSAVSMGAGRDSVDAHVEFFAEFAQLTTDI